MKIWAEIVAGFLSYVFVGWVFVLLYLAIQWLMQTTDVTAACNWSREGKNCHPNFSIRNRSRSKTYLLANIAYSNGADRLVWFDNKSLMGKELKPGSINEFSEVAPVKIASSISECLQLHVAVRLQTGRPLWLEGQGPEQKLADRVQRTAFGLRKFIEKWFTNME